MNKTEIEKIVSNAALGIVRAWRLPIASVPYIERSIISAVEKILASMAKPAASKAGAEQQEITELSQALADANEVIMAQQQDTRLISTSFQLREQFDAHEVTAVTFDRTNSPFYEGERWAIRRTGSVLSKDGEWEYEPTPSNRDDEFYRRCRFDSLEAAVQAFDAAMRGEGGKE